VIEAVSRVQLHVSALYCSLSVIAVWVKLSMGWRVWDVVLPAFPQAVDCRISGRRALGGSHLSQGLFQDGHHHLLQLLAGGSL
jgi:hypothetical protein